MLRWLCGKMFGSANELAAMQNPNTNNSLHTDTAAGPGGMFEHSLDLLPDFPLKSHQPECRNNVLHAKSY